MADALPTTSSALKSGIQGGKSLRATRLIENCTPSIAYDNRIQAAGLAFDDQMFAIIDDTPQIIFIPNILDLPDDFSELVDILAWQFHVDFYDATKDLDFRKRLVQMAIEWHRTKGTVSLVQEVIDTYWKSGAVIEEWWEYMDPLPPNYPDEGGGNVNLGQMAFSNTHLIGHKFDNVLGLTDGQQVTFIPDYGFRIPAPLVPNIFYYVVNADVDFFQLTAFPNQDPIYLLTSGSGTWHVWLKASERGWHDRYKFRISVDQTIIPPEDELQVLTLIDRYKPVSRWCEGIFHPKNSQCNIGWAGMTLQFIVRESEAPNYP